MWTVSLKQLSHYSGAVTNVLSFVIELAQFVVLLSSKIGGGGGGGGGGEGEMVSYGLVPSKVGRGMAPSMRERKVECLMSAVIRKMD